ncbi:hypothetical protein Ancab_014498 [Ancistrocladus abbreviatus]
MVITSSKFPGSNHDLALAPAPAPAAVLVAATMPNPASTPTSKNDSSKPDTRDSLLINKLLDGLITLGFHEGSCLSRYQSYLFRKPSPDKPSPYLISKLRNYEELHRRCGPLSESYKKTVKKLQKSEHSVSSGNQICKYIVWTTLNGLGNRMISMVATFLYAVLTDRVMLVEFENDMMGLFCEPFLTSTWLLPKDFPYRNGFNHLQTFKQIPNSNSSMEIAVPSFLRLDLERGGDDHGKFFHCDHSQSLLSAVPVLVIQMDQYIVPSLFMIPSFMQPLDKMFPKQATVFHHLGRYLFHPSNEVWGLISRFYEAYLVEADEILGLQIRVFDRTQTPFQTVMNQVLACTLKHNLLPEVDTKDSSNSPLVNRTSKAVLVASLHKDYAENLRKMYWKRPTKTGEVIGVHQPSHEEVQKFGDNDHNGKAWAEMYLLSLSDVLVTSGESTFGYVAQGLGGLKPWIMDKTLGTVVRDPPCQRALSMEPCFHFPPKYGCKRKTKVNHIGALFPNMEPCEDFNWGVKLVSRP